MLYLVATPIGNLGDMTFRAVEILKSADLILCEDTRHSAPLLKHFDIQKPLKSYHKFNESAREKELLEQLKEGLSIALISDAGTPGISDPGAQLVKRCIEEGIKVISIPGACAAITALTCSGLNTDRFQFCGFLPRKLGELTKILLESLNYPGTSIFYESPHRLKKALACLHEIAPQHRVAVCRELTKKFEEVRQGLPQELITHWDAHPLKGEIVLLIPGNGRVQDQSWENISIKEHVVELQNQGLSKKDAMKQVAEIRGVPKREIYKEMLQDCEK